MGLEFEYDEFGRLLSVDNGTQTLERYYYDGLGRLAAYEDLTSGEGKQRFAFDLCCTRVVGSLYEGRPRRCPPARP